MHPLRTRAHILILSAGLASGLAAAEPDAASTKLASEVRKLGWIAFAARSPAGDYDLFLMRPDGSQRRALTSTPEWNEVLPQFSRDGKKLLYRRTAKAEGLDGNRHGEQGMPMLANSDGSEPRALGDDGALPWASLNPDATHVLTLAVKGFAVVDLASGKTVRTFPRQGFFQQVTWSPDGKALSGVSNAFGTGWSVARLDLASGKANAVSRIDCCTPDWFPDSQKFIFSSRPPGQQANGGQGWTQLWAGSADGKNLMLVYGEDGRHIYGGHVSPDGRYVLFTGNPKEDGDPQNGGAPMGLLRLSDAPIIGGESSDLRKLHPQAKRGPVLELPAGWEPCWTLSEAPAGGGK